jgi:hypothetical protein
MKTKIRSGGYLTLDEFCIDVGLLWSNCIKFNGKKSQFGKEAMRLQVACKQFRVEANYKLNPTKKRKNSEISSTKSTGTMQNRNQKLTPIPTGKDFKNELILACMLLARPSFQNLLYIQATEYLHECQRKMMLPVQHPILPVLLQLLQVTVVARIQTLASKDCAVGIPAPDQYILRVLCPTFLHFCAHSPQSSSAKKDDPDNKLEDCWTDAIMSKFMGYYARKSGRLGDKVTSTRITSNIPKGTGRGVGLK